MSETVPPHVPLKPMDVGATSPKPLRSDPLLPRTGDGVADAGAATSSELAANRVAVVARTALNRMVMAKTYSLGRSSASATR